MSRSPAQSSLFAPAENTLVEELTAHLERLPPAWRDALDTPEVHQAIPGLSAFLQGRLQAGAEIYPRDPFRALHYLQPHQVQAVILGQDPYHGANQAQGLAFSVPDVCPMPPSLRNIFKELAREYPDRGTRRSHELSGWARQGVLLLNAALTVESGSPMSHCRQGWETITDALIQAVAALPQPKVFLLWGAHAQKKQSWLAEIRGGPMHVLTANHPSPLSAQRPPKPFIGCGHFSAANDWLRANGAPGIDWLAD